MDLAANQLDRWPPSPDAMDRSRAPVDDEIALVSATMEGRMVINVSVLNPMARSDDFLETRRMRTTTMTMKGSRMGLRCLLPRSLVP